LHLSCRLVRVQEERSERIEQSYELPCSVGGMRYDRDSNDSQELGDSCLLIDGTELIDSLSIPWMWC
jgi:hypothetical protein